MPSAAVGFTLSSTVGGQSVGFENPANSIFTYGPSNMGLVERVDLRLSEGVAGLDTDGDGMTDAAERKAGTDPLDAGSVLKGLYEVRPELVAGHFAGIVLEWRSVTGRRYLLHRGIDLKLGFESLGSVVTASGERTSFRDETATGAGPFFYRIEVEP